ncbi:hypothetical protein SBRY_40627 [Actinacidiphila bryophytorum]|uniref:Uncharacterized protein n=1 Tax=Actinacidiphila bryophytorum TaxID=1436133 RepID=A0A9W4H317_9ACTN|nr:hypothetical protein SBRY_40627 [Actinacidiphila bryophytorum]
MVRPHVLRDAAILRCAQPSTVPGAGHHASQQHIEHVTKQIRPRACAAGLRRPAGGADSMQQGGDRREFAGRRQGRQRGRRRRPGLLAQRPARRLRQAVPGGLQRRSGVRDPRHRQGGRARDPRDRAGRRGRSGQGGRGGQDADRQGHQDHRGHHGLGGVPATGAAGRAEPRAVHRGTRRDRRADRPERVYLPLGAAVVPGHHDGGFAAR